MRIGEGLKLGGGEATSYRKRGEEVKEAKMLKREENASIL